MHQKDKFGTLIRRSC